MHTFYMYIFLYKLKCVARQQHFEDTNKMHKRKAYILLYKLKCIQIGKSPYNENGSSMCILAKLKFVILFIFSYS